MQKHALIIGASGVIGSKLATHLLGEGWQVTGVSRGRTPVPAGCTALQLDATDGAAVAGGAAARAGGAQNRMLIRSSSACIRAGGKERRRRAPDGRMEVELAFMVTLYYQGPAYASAAGAEIGSFYRPTR